MLLCALESNEPGQAEWEPNAEEKAMLREEFLSQMHQRFLDGKDDFNYRSNHSACAHRSQILNLEITNLALQGVFLFKSVVAVY